METKSPAPHTTDIPARNANKPAQGLHSLRQLLSWFEKEWTDPCK